MTEKQKKALMLAGGIGAMALVIYFLTRKGPIMVAPAQDTGTYNNVPPGYTSFNVQPINPTPIPNVSVNPLTGSIDVNVKNPLAGCGCASQNDGCFSGNPQTGRDPISMDQLLAWYTNTNPEFAKQWSQQLATYGVGTA